MSKFKTVPSKLTGYIASGTAFKASNSPNQQQQQQQAAAEHYEPESPTA